MNKFIGSINKTEYTDPRAFANAILALDPTQQNEIAAHSADESDHNSYVNWYPYSIQELWPGNIQDPEPVLDRIQTDYISSCDFDPETLCDSDIPRLLPAQKDHYTAELQRLHGLIEDRLKLINENIRALEAKIEHHQAEIDTLNEILDEEDSSSSNLESAQYDIETLIRALAQTSVSGD